MIQVKIIIVEGSEKGKKNKRYTCATNIKAATGRVLVDDDEKKESCRKNISELYNMGRIEEANVNRIDFGDVARNVYR